MTNNVTVIFTEAATPLPPAYPDPMVYWLVLPDEYTEKDVKIACAVDRMYELGANLEELGDIASGINVHLIYPGHMHPIEDWRE